MGRVLVVDDEETVLAAVARRLQRAGHEVETADSAALGVRKIEEAQPPYDAVVTDMSMDEPESGLRILHAAFARDLFAEVLVMTAYGNVQNAVESMRRGAFDYIEKNTPGVDVYELLAEKIGEATARRAKDLRTVANMRREPEA